MKVTAFSNNLFQLTRFVAFNCYLVREDDGFTLIDTNLSGQAQAIMQDARKLGLPIARILLTHAHVDHVGPLPALATWHKGLAQESARKLLALQPSVRAVGHGRMLSQPQVAMERAIRVMERSLAKEERKQLHAA